MDERDHRELQQVRHGAEAVVKAWEAWNWDVTDDGVFRELEVAMARLSEALRPFVPGYWRNDDHQGDPRGAVSTGGGDIPG